MTSKKQKNNVAAESGSEESEGDEELIFNNEAGYDYSQPQRTQDGGKAQAAGSHNFVHLHF